MSKFPMGQTVITANAQATFEPVFVQACLARHEAGDWGDACDQDKATNEQALKTNERLLSSYDAPSGGKLWVITEWDRSVTTVLLPEDY